MKLSRVLKHLLLPAWWVRRAFAHNDLAAIGNAVTAAEKSHRGELRFVVEGPLHVSALWRGLSPRARAAELFATLRVWDTADNSGILIYVQWVDHAVEILADRGIAARVPQAEWNAICHSMEAAFKRGDYHIGALTAIERASQLLAMHFPSSGGGHNELPDRPLVL